MHPRESGVILGLEKLAGRGLLRWMRGQELVNSLIEFFRLDIRHASPPWAQANRSRSSVQWSHEASKFTLGLGFGLRKRNSQLHHPAHPCEIARPAIATQKVVEDPPQDRAGINRIEEPVLEIRKSGHGLIETPCATPRQRVRTVKSIDERRHLGPIRDEDMPRHPDDLCGDSTTSTDLTDDDSEKNRQTPATFDDEMQHRIGRIVIILTIPIEAQIVSQASYHADHIRSFDGHCQRFELIGDDLPNPMMTGRFRNESAPQHEVNVSRSTNQLAELFVCAHHFTATNPQTTVGSCFQVI